MSPQWRKGRPNDVFNWFLLVWFNFLTLEVPTVTTNLKRLAPSSSVATIAPLRPPAQLPEGQ